MSRKKVLVITDNTKDQINGVVTTFKNLEGLARDDGFDLVYLDPGQFAHIRAPGYPEVKLSWPRGIGQAIRKIDPDHVHIATEGPLGLAARCWMDRRGWQYNTSYHTKFPEFIREIYGIPESWTYRYVRWFHKHSGRVLTTTETMVRDLKSHGFTGDIRSWTRGVDRQKLRPSRARAQHQAGQPIVLYVGRVSREKGLDDLCCLTEHYTIIIVGDGPYRSELSQRYPDVHFVGYKSGSDLADYYHNADVFCFPSQTDTFGIVMIESMSLGTPVAAYPVAGPVDVIDQGVTGHMSWDLKSSIDMCLTYPRDRVELASQRWTWDRCWEIFRDNLINII
jgi:glycosyltransferase involved in cell wall biosynthesis